MQYRRKTVDENLVYEAELPAGTLSAKPTIDLELTVSALDSIPGTDKRQGGVAVWEINILPACRKRLNFIVSYGLRVGVPRLDHVATTRALAPYHPACRIGRRHLDPVTGRCRDGQASRVQAGIRIFAVPQDAELATFVSRSRLTTQSIAIGRWPPRVSNCYTPLFAVVHKLKLFVDESSLSIKTYSPMRSSRRQEEASAERSPERASKRSG